MNWLRKLLRGAALALLILTVAAVAAFAWIQTGPGKRQLAGLIGALASDDRTTVEISDIDGFLPFQLQIGRATVSDHEGAWLRVQDAVLDWSPTALLFGRLEVEALSVRRLALERLPTGSNDPAAKGGLSFPLAIYVAQVDAADISLAEPVLGAPVRLSFVGMAELADPELGFRLIADVSRIDATPGDLSIAMGFEPQSRRLTAELEATEPAGGVIARLLDLPGLPAVSIRLFGDGPLEKWLAQLALDAGPDLAANADIGIVAVGADHLVTLDGDATLAGLVAGPASALLAGRSRLSGRALIGERGRIALDRIALRMAGGTVTLAGEVDWRRGTLDADIGVVAAEPTVFADMLPGISWGRAEADFRILGDFADPRIEAALAVGRFEAPGVAIAEIAGEVFLNPVADPANGGVRLWGEGSLAGTSLGTAELDALLSGGVGWQIAGSAGLDGSLALEEVRIAVADTVLSGSGDRSPDGAVAASGTLTIADLETYRSLATLPIDGRAELSWQARAADGGLSLTADGTVAGPRSGIAELDTLLSDEADIAAEAMIAPDGGVDIDGIRIASGENALTGRARIAGERLNADWAVSVPSVAPMLEVIEAAADGRLAASGVVEGPLDRLSLGADVRLTEGIYDGLALPDLSARLALHDLAQPVGTVRVEGAVAEMPAVLETGFASLDDSRVRFDPIAADFAGWSVTGALDLLSDGLVDGRLAARAGDVDALAALFDVPFSGEAEIAADLSDNEGRQDLRATVALVGPAYESVTAAGANAEIEIADLIGDPRLQAVASASNLTAGGARFDRVDIDAQGTVEALALSMAVAGDDLSGEASGRIASTGGTTRIDLETLRSDFRGEPFVLAAPAVILIGPESLTVDRLTLEAGPGRATVSGSLGDTLEASMEVTSLPLALLALVEPGLPVSGHIDGAARVSGPLSQPEGIFELRSADIRSEYAEDLGLPPATLRADGRWSGGRLEVDAAADLTDGTGLELVATLPLRLAADGSGPVFDNDAAVTATVAGTLDVSLFDDLLAAAGNRVEGRLSIELGASGTLAEPAIAGTATLSEGRYENAFYGSRLDDIAAVVTASGAELRLTDLSASTPGGGTLAGTGLLALDADKGYPFQLDAILRNGAVVDTALASATADADLRLSGALTESLLLAGEVSILAAEFRVPDRLPVSVPDLPVEEVNLPPDMAAERAARRPSDPAAAVDAELDIVASARQAVFVRGRGLDAELQGDLTIRGTADAPAIGGELTLRSGTLDLLGRRLAFQRGVLGFDGSSELDPDLDFQAGTDVADVSVQVEVGGRVSEPAISLSSVPELPQDEIVARLLFDKDVSSLSAFEAVTLAQSVGQLTGLTGSSAGLLEQMRQRIGLDRLDVDVGDDSGQASVSGGRYVGDGVYVGVEQGLDEQSSRVNVEIEVTPNVKVESDVGADAEGRIGVNLEWDY